MDNIYSLLVVGDSKMNRILSLSPEGPRITGGRKKDKK